VEKLTVLVHRGENPRRAKKQKGESTRAQNYDRARASSLFALKHRSTKKAQKHRSTTKKTKKHRGKHDCESEARQKRAPILEKHGSKTACLRNGSAIEGPYKTREIQEGVGESGAKNATHYAMRFEPFSCYTSRALLECFRPGRRPVRPSSAIRRAPSIKPKK
jgi:hypothetical protein